MIYEISFWLLGLWTALFFFGCFIGPTFGGFFVARFGFRWMTFVEWMSIAYILIIDIIHLVLSLESKAQKRKEFHHYNFSELN